MRISRSTTQLFEYQKQIVEKLLTNFDNDINSICILDIGSGKTRIACEILKTLRATKQFTYALVLAPTSAILHDAWKRELENINISSQYFCDRNFILRHKCSTQPLLAIRTGSVLLSTYQFLTQQSCKRDNYEVIEYFENTPPTFIICDEFHYISNTVIPQEQLKEKSLQKTIRERLRRIPSKRSLGLTATPLINTPAEREIAFELLNPHRTDKMARQEFWVNGNENNVRNTHAQITTLVFPLREQEYQECNHIMTTESSPLSQMHCTDILLLCGKRKSEHYVYEVADTHFEQLSKIRVLKTILLTMPKDSKAIVVSKEAQALEYLCSQASWLTDFHPVLFCGKNTTPQALTTFCTNPDCRVFLTSVQKGGQGLNLQVANYLIILDLEWTPKDYHQLIGRIDRIGQLRTPFVYILAPQITMSYYITKISDKKQEMLRSQNLNFPKSFDHIIPSNDCIEENLAQLVKENEQKYSSQSASPKQPSKYHPSGFIFKTPQDNNIPPFNMLLYPSFYALPYCYLQPNYNNQPQNTWASQQENNSSTPFVGVTPDMLTDGNVCNQYYMLPQSEQKTPYDSD